MADLTCPCEDGLPDPCTLCGEPADGVCKIDLVHADAYRRGVEAERRRILSRLDACDDDYDEFLRLIVAQKPALGDGAIGTAAAALAELRRIVSPPQEGVNYDGPDGSVECAWGPCTNRLRKMGLGDIGQWCSTEHRSLSLGGR